MWEYKVGNNVNIVNSVYLWVAYNISGVNKSYSEISKKVIVFKKDLYNWLDLWSIASVLITLCHVHLFPKFPGRQCNNHKWSGVPVLGVGVGTHPSEVPCLEGVEWWRCDYSPLWGHMSGVGWMVEVWLLTPLRSHVWSGRGGGGEITQPSEVTFLEGDEWWRCDYSPLWGHMSGGNGVVEVRLLTPLRSHVSRWRGGGDVITHPPEVTCLEGMGWWRCNYLSLWGHMSGGGGVVEVWLLTRLRSHVWKGWGWWRWDYSPLWGHMSGGDGVVEV